MYTFRKRPASSTVENGASESDTISAFHKICEQFEYYD